MGQLAVRTEHRLLPDPRRVIAKPYLPGEDAVASGDARAGLLVRRVLAIPESDVVRLLAAISTSFSGRHRAFEEMLDRHFELVAHHVPPGTKLTRERRALVGAYFTHEYSIEGAALFNPSIVAAPDQDGLAQGQQRFVMSLRAVGEGHISSIEFRSGVIGDRGLSFEEPSTVLVTGDRAPAHRYDRERFQAKLVELGAGNELAWAVLGRLPAHFSLAELEQSLARLESEGPSHAISYETLKIIRVLAASNYVTSFPASSRLGERVIFPAGPNETRGMEDARFVRFVDEAGVATYYATYTAYDGFQILPQLIQTEDFLSFNISTLNGFAAQNKGMALFPRKVGGKYVMLSRKDRENLHLATSEDVHFWNDVTELDRPFAPWQLLQIGNCGSPIETEAGWLVLTHGVGPMRQYGIGALLLDLEDPRRIIGRLPEPLLLPDATEREGYVPNVVYSCGALVHGQQLVLPYGFSDSGIGVALVSVPDLLGALTSSTSGAESS
jgi:predicted GH43/DUF377 family glycosyl hydrolase